MEWLVSVTGKSSSLAQLDGSDIVRVRRACRGAQNHHPGR